MNVMPSVVETLIGVVTLFLSGGGLGSLPLSMPPAAPDPVMAQVAPEDCLLYLSWSGTAEASADSENRTEQLLADPEVRHFVEGLEQRLIAALDDGAGQSARGQAIAESVPVLLETLVVQPAAFFVGRVTLGNQGLATPVGLVVNVDGREAGVEAAMKAMQKAAQPNEEIEIVELDGRKWQRWPTPLGAPTIVWGIFDRYFVAAAGPGTPTQILERINGESTPEWLTAVQERLPVERQALISHLNVKGIVENVSMFLGTMAPQVLGVMKPLGVENIQSLTTVTGLDGDGCVTRTWLKVDGELNGILTPLDAEPLAATDLSPIPADATAAFAVRLNADRLLNQFTKLLANFDPRGAERIDADLKQFDEEVGFGADDVIAALGDVWCVYQSPSEGGTLMTGWTAVVSLRDSEKAREIAAIIAKNARKIEQDLVQQLGRRGVRSLSVADYEFQGHTVYFLNAVGESVPVAPAWCITDDELVFSVFPQGVNSYLRRGQRKSLQDNPTVAASLKKDRSPLFLGYYDSQRLLQLAWPMVQIGANLACAELQQRGLKIDVSLLPSLAALDQYVSGATVSVVPGDDGIELISRRVLPLGPEVGVIAALPLLGFANVSPMRVHGPVIRMSPLDALSPVRAQRTRSTHNLKQIGLAMHNHHSTFNQLPDEAVRDNAGKPLLSWRVKLLPFLGQRKLFDRFRINEPWDSEHNKALIEEMPNVFKVPGVELPAGRTSYVGLVGAGTLFDPTRKAVRFRDIVDGTSNTLLVVEAPAESAVVWTKPDDLPFDPDEPRAGVTGARRGGFLALLCDGAVAFLSDDITDEMIRDMSIRNDGNAVKFRNVPSRPVRGGTRAPATRSPAGEQPEEATRE